MTPDHLQQLAEARERRRPVVRWTRLETGESGICYDAGEAPDDLREEIEARFRSGKSGIVSSGKVPSFIATTLPLPRLVAVGAVHISQALVPLARTAGIETLIVDPRTAFATTSRFEGSTLVADWPEDVADRLALDRHTALAALTHDPKIDDFPLKAALEADCFYVGALGSRKTHAKRLERLRNAGLDDNALARIRAPIGLDIGAANPAEIAVAILAEIIEAMRKR